MRYFVIKKEKVSLLQKIDSPGKLPTHQTEWGAYGWNWEELEEGDALAQGLPEATLCQLRGINKASRVKYVEVANQNA